MRWPRSWRLRFCRSINALLGRASAYRQAAALDLALADAREALDFARRFQGRKPTSFRTGLACLMMARIHQEQGDIAAASQTARTAVEPLTNSVDRNPPGLALARRLANLPGGAVDAPVRIKAATGS